MDRDLKPSSTCFLGGLPRDYKEQEIRDIFTKIGPISKIDFKAEFAFVHYQDAKDADEAIKALHNSKLDGSTLSVELAKGDKRPSYSRPLQRQQSRSDYRIIVENIPYNLSWQDLKDHARRVGDIARTDVIKDVSHPYGIVEFKNYASLKRALSELDKSVLDGKTIYVKEDISRDFKPYTDYRRDNYRRDDFRRDDYGRDDYRRDNYGRDNYERRDNYGRGGYERRGYERRDNYERRDYERKSPRDEKKMTLILVEDQFLLQKEMKKNHLLICNKSGVIQDFLF